MNGRNAKKALGRAPRWQVGRVHAVAHAALVTLFCLLLAIPGVDAQPRPTDYQVKAAYLYNFGRFVEWPPAALAAKDSFTVCVMGQDPFGATLDTTLAGETIGGKSVVARRISDVRESAGCQILFLSSSESDRLKDVLSSLDKTGVLTVSDIPQFSQHGGMIEFVLQSNRVRFEVNLAAARSAGLTLSSELLKVATVVRRDSGAGN